MNIKFCTVYSIIYDGVIVDSDDEGSEDENEEEEENEEEADEVSCLPLWWVLHNMQWWFFLFIY